MMKFWCSSWCIKHHSQLSCLIPLSQDDVADSNQIHYWNCCCEGVPYVRVPHACEFLMCEFMVVVSCFFILSQSSFHLEETFHCHLFRESWLIYVLFHWHFYSVFPVFTCGYWVNILFLTLFIFCMKKQFELLHKKYHEKYMINNVGSSTIQHLWSWVSSISRTLKLHLVLSLLVLLVLNLPFSKMSKYSWPSTMSVCPGFGNVGSAS